jgi:hypothetical protein
VKRRARTHEVNSDGGNVAFGVCVVCEPQQQARLSDTRVTDKEEFEEVVVSADTGVSGWGWRTVHFAFRGSFERYKCRQAARALCEVRISIEVCKKPSWTGCCLAANTAAINGDGTYYSGFIVRGGSSQKLDLGVPFGGEGTKEAERRVDVGRCGA